MSVYNKFNRGEIDPLAIARDDVTKVNNSCSLMNNFFPLRLGPMQYRQGFGYVGAISDETYLIPFVAATDDTAILEFTDSSLRIWSNDSLIERSAVSTTIPDGDFSGSPSAWSDASGSGSTATFDTGKATLTGSGNTSAKIYQTITTETGVENALRIIVDQSSVELKIGTSGVDSDDIYAGDISQGEHSLVFTPDSKLYYYYLN